MSDEVDYLSFIDVIRIAEGVLPEVSIRDVGLIESAVARPQATVFGDLAYPTLPLQAGSLLHSVARNHPLVDGNKRLAWSAMRVFLLMNGHDMVFDIDEAEQLVLEIAQGISDVADIADWLTRRGIPS